MKKELLKLKQQLIDLKKQQIEKSREYFIEESKTLFNKYEELNSFSWTQYTPYFNDGEECVFYANTSDVSINGYDYYGDKDDGINKNLLNMSKEEIYVGSSATRVRNPNFSHRAEAIVDELKEFLSVFEDETLKDIFGDHSMVEISRNGVKVSDYSHD